MPMQYTEIFLALKNKKIQLKVFDIFVIFAHNIDCGYALEPNEYPQSMFLARKRKINISLHTSVLLYKMGV